MKNIKLLKDRINHILIFLKVHEKMHAKFSDILKDVKSMSKYIDLRKSDLGSIAFEYRVSILRDHEKTIAAIAGEKYLKFDDGNSTTRVLHTISHTFNIDAKAKSFDHILSTSSSKELALTDDKDILKPSKIYKGLDGYAIGQEAVKKALAVYAANHFNSIMHNPEAQRQALLIIGQSGTGKTLLVNSLGKVLGKPVKTLDITEYSQEGYVGKSLSDLPGEMVDELGDDAENCILFIDEVDKLAFMDGMSDSVQFGLLKLIEGKHASGPHRRTPASVDFSKVCIVLGGAFTQVFDKKKTEAEGKTIGFDNEIKEVPKQIDLTHEDIVKAGLKRELVGRVGNLVSTNPLTEDMWIDIITKPKNCILEHYNKLFKDNNIDDKVSKKDAKAILEKAQSIELGVRGLWAVAAEHFRDRLFH